jgi:hypothetical protein
MISTADTFKRTNLIRMGYVWTASAVDFDKMGRNNAKCPYRLPSQRYPAREVEIDVT